MKFDGVQWGGATGYYSDKELEYQTVLIKQAQIKKIVNYLLKKKVG